MTHFGAKEFKGDPFHELKKKKKKKKKKTKNKKLRSYLLPHCLTKLLSLISFVKNLSLKVFYVRS